MYSPPPALAISISDPRSSAARIGGSRGEVSFGLRSGSGMKAPTVVPTPTTKTGTSLVRAVLSARATSPLQAWPSVTSTNAFAFGDLPYSSVSFSISRMPHAMPSSMLVSQLVSSSSRNGGSCAR